MERTVCGFDVARTKAEFTRIIRPHGHVALLWNLRQTLASTFMRAYDQLFRKHGIDYEKAAVEHSFDMDKIATFFAPRPFATYDFPHRQVLDWDGLLERIRSTSYCPTPEHPNYPQLLAEAQRIYHAHAHDGCVEMLYSCMMYVGVLSHP